MPKEAVFTMKLEPELRADFMAEAKAASASLAALTRADARLRTAPKAGAGV